MSREDLHHDQLVLDTLEKYVMDLKKENVQDGRVCFSLLRGWFNAEKEYDNGFDKAAKQLEYVILWRVLLRVDRNLWYLLQN